MQTLNLQANAKVIDISRYQSSINWAQVKSDGISGAIIKATEGHTYIDPCLHQSFAGAKQYGFAVGIYHFLRANSVGEAIQEAEFFCSILDSMGSVSALHIPPALDLEYGPKYPPPPNVNEVAIAWLDYVHQRYGISPMVYTYPWFIQTHLKDSICEYPLWYAYRGGNQPVDRLSWSEWEFLQYDTQASVQGVYGFCDINVYKGSEAELLYKMSVNDANMFLKDIHAKYSVATTKSEKDELHRLANELRKASGQPIQPPL